MRRLATIAPVAVAALALMGAPAMADGHGHASAHAAKQHKSHSDHGDGDHKVRPKPHKAHQVTLTGFISATPTATIGSMPSDTATVTVTVKGGGGGALRGATVTVVIDMNTVVRRKGPGRSAADLRLGDHVSVRGFLVPATATTPATLYATRLNAAAAKPEESAETGEHG